MASQPTRIGSDPQPGRSAPCAGIEVELSDLQGCFKVDHQALAALVRDVLSGEGRPRASISIVLLDDAAIRDVNRRHLNHDWPTDVITFRLSDEDEPELCAELVVSAEMAVATAREANVDAWAELALYVVHGLLHLCGFEDDTESGRAAMRRREQNVLAAAGLTNTFPLVAGATGGDGAPIGERMRWPG